MIATFMILKFLPERKLSHSEKIDALSRTWKKDLVSILNYKNFMIFQGRGIINQEILIPFIWQSRGFEFFSKNSLWFALSLYNISHWNIRWKFFI